MLSKTFLILAMAFSTTADAESWNLLSRYPEYIENAYALEIAPDIVGTRFEKYWDHGPMNFSVIYFNCKNKTQRLIGMARFYDNGELDFKHRPEDVTFTPADINSANFIFACKNY